MEILNRIAHYNYFIEDEYVCGIVLTGTEIKSIRKGNCNIKDSYATIRDNEVYLLNTHISPYEQGNINNHQETRTRKLLLHKSEIIKLNDKIKKEGYTLIPLKIFFDKSHAKVLLGLCKGKKEYDKRQTIKERDLNNEAKKIMKNNWR